MAKDFRNKQFGRILRGYNPEEVDEYIAYISDEYRKLERRCANYERQLALALKNLDEMHRKAEIDDRSVQNAAADEAKAEAERVIADASRRADEILAGARKDAEAEAKKILGNAAKTAEVIMAGAENDSLENRQKADALFRASEKMYDEVCAFRESLFAIYNTHVASFDQITAEADRTMGVIRDAYEGNADDEEEICEEEPDVVTEPDEDIGESSETAEAEAAPDVFDSAAAEEDAAEKDDPLLMMLVRDLVEEELSPDESDIFAAEDDWDEEVYRAADSEPEADAGSASEAEDYSDDDYDALDVEVDDSFQIDWSSRHQQNSSDAENFADEEEQTEPAEEAAFQNLDDMFTEEPERELSLTDEFDLVFNGNNARRNVEEIRRQPTVAPEKPKNPKKHQKF